MRRYNKDRVYKKRGSYKTKRVDKIKAIVRIDQRPKEINKRTVLGHWETDLVVFFPYCSWQKGTIENTNGLIRVIFPKQTNFDSITNEQIQQLEDWINNRPKKCLNFFTPKDVFFSSVALAT